jgi:hypothetical protein
MTDKLSSNNIVRFTGLTKLDLEPDAILNKAIGELREVLIIGTTLDGNQYLASSSNDAKNMIWHVETAKFMIMESIFYAEDDDE